MTNSLLHRLGRQIEYSFQNNQLLQLALTHRSFGNKNNERLEFLGDSIINWIMAEHLFQRFPTATEGELTRLRASLVNKTSLAEVAKNFNLGDYLQLGEGELKSGGFRRDSILADTLEAMVAAIYLDADIETVKAKVLKWFDQQLQSTSLDKTKDPKTRLQEFMQSRQVALPEYVIVETKGKDHDHYFYVECRSSALATPVCGEGRSRRAAEQMAAQAALTLLGLDEKR